MEIKHGFSSHPEILPSMVLEKSYDYQNKILHLHKIESDANISVIKQKLLKRSEALLFLLLEVGRDGMFYHQNLWLCYSNGILKKGWTVMDSVAMVEMNCYLENMALACSYLHNVRDEC